jgi:phenylalanine ammonia-lyase
MDRVEIGQRRLTIEDVTAVARGGAAVAIAEPARERVRQGRRRLEELIERGERIYGVNTGVGANVKIAIAPERMEKLQHNLIRQLSCATGRPLPEDVVRAATLLRVATFATGASAVRPELVDALAALLNCGITPLVPRYGSVGASGDLIPSAYIARTLEGMGEVFYQGRAMPAAEALRLAGLAPIRYAPKETLALINGTTVMTGAATLVWVDARVVLRALVGAVALAVEALEAPDLPFEPWVNQAKGHPGQIAVAAEILGLLQGSGYTRASGGQSCYSLRCAPQGLGPAWEGLEDGRAVLEREIDSANDNPLIDPETGVLYKAGNFYGGHIARLLDAWKLDLAAMGNWGNALMALLIDERFNGGLPNGLTQDPGLNSGFKGMQLSATSLCCAIRQMAGPSLIHSLPTEQYNQDVVSLGMHAAVTAMDALNCLRNLVAMVLLATAQAIDLRGGPEKLAPGTRALYDRVRSAAPFLDGDRAQEAEIAAVAAAVVTPR